MSHRRITIITMLEIIRLAIVNHVIKVLSFWNAFKGYRKYQHLKIQRLSLS